MRRAYLSLVMTIGFALGRLAAQEMPVEAVRKLYQDAIAAYEKKDYAAYLQRIETVAEQRPAHPVLLRRLASAYALNARPADAARVLGQMASLSIYHNTADDPDFTAVRDDPSVKLAVRDLEAVHTRRIGSSEIAWIIPDRMFIPEGVAYDPVSREFFVSSQYRRKIVRIDRSGGVQDFVTSGRDGLWMVFGLAVDPARRLLWAVSTAEPVMERFTKADENATGLFAFELSSGKLAHRYELSERSAAHRFDDVTVSTNGRVFVSDSGSGAIYTLALAGPSLELFVPPGTIQGPNGMTTTPDGRVLYVSDYAGFIFRVDTATRAASRLAAPPGAALYGIDGLAWHNGSLLGVQNGIEPSRVLRLDLSADGSRITAVRIVDMNHPRVAEPTLGVVVGGAFYYVANSFGGVLRKPNAVLEEQPLAEPVILRLGL